MLKTSAPRGELPRGAGLPLNRCNLPASLLGSYRFHQRPLPLKLDGVEMFHAELFRRHLPALQTPEERAKRFADYIDVAFRLHRPEELGSDQDKLHPRSRASCFQIIRGWAFDSDSLEAAVLKGWAESRFGLVARFHKGKLHEFDSDEANLFRLERVAGAFGAAALEEQLDLLYTYCQYELALTGQESLRLYRGLRSLADMEVLEDLGDDRCLALLGNISSFTRARERAEEFGLRILEIQVPVAKLVFHDKLIPHLLTGEEECLVLGGVYETKVHRY